MGPRPLKIYLAILLLGLFLLPIAPAVSSNEGKITENVLKETKRVLTNDGHSAYTTLVQGNRWSNRYLSMLAQSGALVSRSFDEVLSVFNEVDMTVTHELKGNLGFIKYG